jgi:hypothetical protein
VLIEDRQLSGWLGDGGAIRAWPLKHSGAVSVSFVLSLPKKWPATVRVHLGRRHLRLHPGQSIAVRCRSASGALDVQYSSPNPQFNLSLQRVIAQLSALNVVDAPAAAATGPACSTA